MNSITNKFAIFRSMPAILCISIILSIVIGNSLPEFYQQCLYTISIFLKELLMFMIPFIIFSSIFNAFTRTIGNSLFLVGSLIIMVIISNFISVSIAGIFGNIFFTDHIQDFQHFSSISNSLSPIITISLPKLIPNNVALILAFCFSLIYQIKQFKCLKVLGALTTKATSIFMNKIFIQVLPLFVVGFLFKIIHDNMLQKILTYNPKAVLFMIVLMFSYLFILLLIAGRLSHKKCSTICTNITEPTITAISSMSSAAALPFSIKAASNNANEYIANIVMPTTVNIHMIGDAICIPLMAMMVMQLFEFPMPSLGEYLLFTLFFVMTKFSGAAIPGGSILVMIPVLEKYLNFTPEMSGIITIFYILMDPITTCGNVIGNNIFVIIFNRIITKFNLTLLQKV